MSILKYFKKAVPTLTDSPSTKTAEEETVNVVSNSEEPLSGKM